MIAGKRARSARWNCRKEALGHVLHAGGSDAAGVGCVDGRLVIQPVCLRAATRFRARAAAAVIVGTSSTCPSWLPGVESQRLLAHRRRGATATMRSFFILNIRWKPLLILLP
jgi:hypothetical protein